MTNYGLVAGVVLTLISGAAASQERAQTLSRNAFFAQTTPGTLGYVIDGAEEDGCSKDFTSVAPLEGDGWFRPPDVPRLCLVVNNIDPDNPVDRLTLSIETTKVFDGIDIDAPPSVDTLLFSIEEKSSSFDIPFLRRDSIGGRSPLLISLSARNMKAIVVETRAEGDLSFRRRAAFLLN